ncbi:MAG: hydroxylamine reductase [Elusimicrobiales bacterium]
MTMYCRQCEQTQGGKNCLNQGVCGKTAETAAMQDMLVYALKGLGFWGHQARKLGIADEQADRLVMEGLFTTVTNVNFAPETIAPLIGKAAAARERLRGKVMAARPFTGTIPAAAEIIPAQTVAELLKQSGQAALPADSANEDIRSLREILLYGLKGMAAYADHAAVLGKSSDEVNAFFHEGLAALTDNSLSAQDYVALIMRFGQVNLKCLELLDDANTGAYGHPAPVKVPLGHKKGPAILVSGHDLRDLYQLLEQTKDKGITVYTHGEMLPAHAYPKLKAFPHFYGHYGTAWQNQYKEFDAFPGAILMTTNCIQRPAKSYMDRIFTTGLVQWPGVEHIGAGEDGAKDFSPVIRKAVAAGGFSEDAAGKEITVGFGRNTLLGAAETVVKLVKAGKIRHFFLIGGCDGAKPGRNYYTEFAQKIPKDCLILTLACGKFRFNTLEFGELEGLPRLLDCGQCNDAYTAIVIASALAKAFNCSVNELPLSLVLSWYEQKAVCILLTLFSLGIKNIRLGPSLPAFVSPNVLNILVENFAIKPVSTPDNDLAEMLGAIKR